VIELWIYHPLVSGLESLDRLNNVALLSVDKEIYLVIFSNIYNLLDDQKKTYLKPAWFTTKK